MFNIFRRRNARNDPGSTQAAGVTLPMALDPQGEIARAWGVRVFPSTILIDTAGRAQPMLPGMAAAQQAHTENTLMASSNLRD